MPDFARIEALFVEFLDHAEVLSESERAEVARFVDVGEYGLGLETAIAIYAEEKKVITGEDFALLEHLAQLMNLPQSTDSIRTGQG